MALAYIIIKKVLFMKENGKMTFSMDLEWKNGLMGLGMKANI
jgi:hypothetical protein